MFSKRKKYAQIKEGGPITLTHPEVTRYFMTIPEAAQLVIQAGAISQDKEVLILDMGKPVKILDLAKRMITLAGYRPIFNENRSEDSNDISIDICGLQPGEKLHEELFYGPNLQSTLHPRILKSVEKPMCSVELQNLLSRVRVAIQQNDQEEAYRVLSAVSGSAFNAALRKTANREIEKD